MLYGGLNPVNIFYVYMGTTTLVLFTSGVLDLGLDSGAAAARRDPDHLWSGCALVAGAAQDRGDLALSRRVARLGCTPFNDLLILTNPITVWSNATYRDSTFWNTARLPFSDVRIGFVWHFAIMAAIQTLAGLLFVGVAVAGLRPLRGSSWPGGKPHTGWFARLAARYRRFVEARATAALVRNQLLVNQADRPPCGDDPMLWKERFTRMGGGLKWLGSRPVALFFIVFLCCYLFDVAVPAVGGFTRSLWQARTWGTWFEMNAALRTSSAILAALVMLPISAAAGASVTSEREQDTWTSLATTLLSPVEVIRGKQLGSIWSARWLGIGLVAMLGTGLLLGAFHPLGLFAALAVLATSSWLSAAIGVLASTLARNSTRAAFFTFFAMFVFVWASGWPSVFWQTLASYADMRYLWSGEVPVGYSRRNLVAPPLLGAAVLSAVDSDPRGLAHTLVDQAPGNDLGAWLIKGFFAGSFVPSES